MLKVFELSQKCTLLLDGVISKSETENIELLLNKSYYLYEINFSNIYTISDKLILLLYKNIYKLNKNIEIVVSKNRLSKYLHQLGFNTIFVSSLKKLQIKNHSQNVLAIGGSANSSEKIINILSKIDTSLFTTFIIQHVNSKSSSVFNKVLAPCVDAKVVYVEDRMEVKQGYIYIAKADWHMKVIDGFIHLDNSIPVNYSRPSISVSFESLSKEYKDRLVVVLECGYGTDGVDSLHNAIKIGSTVIIQNPKKCEAKIIPKSAIELNNYHFVFDEETIVEYLSLMVRKFKNNKELLKYFFDEIYRKYEYDYRNYQEEYVQRRVESFMIKHAIKDLKVAVILVLFNKIAFKSLFLDLSINVTEFFREIESLKKIKNILEKEYRNNFKIKIWSAGCSSGKEVYSMGILLDKLGLIDKSLIYATDFNPVVIEEAKNAIYPLEQFKKAKEKFDALSLDGLLDDEFDINDNFVKIKDRVKKNILFFTHNLEKDSVFNEFDIIECKNVLIYFNDELKNKIVNLLYDSLKFGGYLSLGSSELLSVEFNDKFEICDEKSKIYKKVA